MILTEEVEEDLFFNSDGIRDDTQSGACFGELFGVAAANVEGCSAVVWGRKGRGKGKLVERG